MQVSSICLPSKDGLLTQHSRCNVGWVQKCKYTHIERTLSPSTWTGSHIQPTQTEKGTHGRERTYTISIITESCDVQLSVVVMILTIVLQHLATTEEMGYFHITPVFVVLGCWPTALFMDFPVLFSFWYFLVILSFPCYLPLPCTFLHSPSFELFPWTINKTELCMPKPACGIHIHTLHDKYWTPKNDFLSWKGFFFSAKADLDHSFHLFKPVMLRIWPSHLSFDIYFMANNCIRRAS